MHLLLFSILVLAGAGATDGAVNVHGRSAARGGLAADAYGLFVKIAGAYMKCEAIELAQVIESRQGADSVDETWIGQGCGKAERFTVGFRPAPQGGYNFSITKAVEPAPSFNNLGFFAERSGDFALAERNYERGLLDARRAGVNASISAALYGAGRMKGYQCKFDEAEPLLIESLKIEEGISGPENGSTTARLLEIARFYYDRGLRAQAVPYFARAIPVVVKLGAERDDPIALAQALDEFSGALASAGRAPESEKAKREADEIRARNGGKSARYAPIRYGSGCESRGTQSR